MSRLEEFGEREEWKKSGTTGALASHEIMAPSHFDWLSSLYKHQLYTPQGPNVKTEHPSYTLVTGHLE